MANALYDRSNYIVKRRSIFDSKSKKGSNNKRKESYGCEALNWSPDVQTTDDELNGKSWLIMEFQRVIQDKSKIKLLLNHFIPDLFFSSRGELSDDEGDKDEGTKAFYFINCHSLVEH